MAVYPVLTIGMKFISDKYVMWLCGLKAMTEHGKSHPSPSLLVPCKSLKTYPYAAVGTIVGLMISFLKAKDLKSLGKS